MRQVREKTLQLDYTGETGGKCVLAGKDESGGRCVTVGRDEAGERCVAAGRNEANGKCVQPDRQMCVMMCDNAARWAATIKKEAGK